nr:hypothetical protein [Psychrobacter okhotskensis]
MHMLCTMPNNDADFSKRIKLIKYYFSYHIAKTEYISNSRLKKSERGIWQRRFWEHCIRDEADYRAHIDYIPAIKKSATLLNMSMLNNSKTGNTPHFIDL